MRTLLFLLLLGAPALGQQRTWTIATAVVTTEAELISVRGDTAYLKVGDRIENVPLERLSVADHQYIASLSLAPIRSDLGASGPETDSLPMPGQGGVFMPPAIGGGPAITEEAIPLPAAPATTNPVQGARGAATRSDSGNRAASVRGAGSSSAAYRATGAAGTAARGASNSTARRLVPPPNQLQNGVRGNSDPNPGILGIRERRDDRLRGR